VLFAAWQVEVDRKRLGHLLGLLQAQDPTSLTISSPAGSASGQRHQRRAADVNRAAAAVPASITRVPQPLHVASSSSPRSRDDSPQDVAESSRTSRRIGLGQRRAVSVCPCSD